MRAATDNARLTPRGKAAERIKLSERDSLRVLELLENPPEPNERLRRAAESLTRIKK
jgi:uncharacterized protein (DUF1778 family)